MDVVKLAQSLSSLFYAAHLDVSFHTMDIYDTLKSVIYLSEVTVLEHVKDK